MQLELALRNFFIFMKFISDEICLLHCTFFVRGNRGDYFAIKIFHKKKYSLKFATYKVIEMHNRL